MEIKLDFCLLTDELLVACKKNDINKINQLIEAGADVNKPQKYEKLIHVWDDVLGVELSESAVFSRHPLITAIKYGNVDVVRILIENGADINIICDNGWSPIHFCVLWEMFDIAKILIENGANINATDKSGRTPLHHASLHPYPKQIRALIELGADVNKADFAGETPLHYAVGFIKKSLTAVNILIQAGADVNISNNAGETPLSLVKSLECGGEFYKKEKSIKTKIIKSLTNNGGKYE